jgi:septal ring factor EnvC (AmiA/AmiB activator)
MSAADRVDDPRPDERAALQAEIAQVREELGETVEALVDKADVKAQVHEKVEHGTERLRETEQRVKTRLSDLARRALEGPAVPATVAVVCALLLARSLRR